MRTQNLFIAFVVVLFSMPVFAGTTAAVMPPDQVVRQTATEMLAAVSSQREELKQHPQDLYGIIDKILRPHFDLDYASRLVLGPYWRSATPVQRVAFEQAFYKYLVHSYANGLLHGNYSDRNVRVEAWRGNANDTHAMIRSQVLRQNAPPVQVDYAMVRTQDGWKAFDVSLEGISYVMNYRNQFGPEIQQRGIEELIKRLNAEADKAVPSQPQTGGF